MSEEAQKLLRYAELASKKARAEATNDELAEMEAIRASLGLSEEEIVARAEAEVHRRYP